MGYKNDILTHFGIFALRAGIPNDEVLAELDQLRRKTIPEIREICRSRRADISEAIDEPIEEYLIGLSEGRMSI